MRAASLRMQSSGGRPGSRYLPHDWRSAFHSDSLASHYAACTTAALTALPAEDERTMLLPPTFNRVWPLDDIASHGTSDSLGFVSDTFKAVQDDGLLCAVRRVDGARASPAHLSKVRTMWTQVSHPNLLPLLNCFMAAGAAFFVREFCAGAVALPALVSQQGPLPEHNLRRWTSQLLAVLATAHAAGLSFRRLPAAHILIGEFGVLRVNHCGLMDALDRAGTDSMAAQQAQDLRAAAAVLLYAATSEPLDVIMDSPEHATAVLGRAKSLVSAPLHALLEQALSAAADGRVTAAGLVQQSMAAWGSELLALSQRHSDAMSAHLASSATNGRLLRSLVKLGFVNERLEHEGDPAWAETGDRYMLKLFRDWLFHQVNETGKPVLDVGHVMAGLLKMDAGVESERALLSSRDGTAFMGVTFSYLRTMLNKSYAELASVAAGPSMETVGAMATAEHRRQTRQQQTLLRQLSSGLPSLHSSAAPAMPHEPAPASAGYPVQQHSAPSGGSIWGAARRTVSGPAAARSPVPEFVPGKGMQYR